MSSFRGSFDELLRRVRNNIPPAFPKLRLQKLKRSGDKPVIVYQMGKVGSSSVYEALVTAGLTTFQVHRMNPAHIRMLQGRSPAFRLRHEAVGEALYSEWIQKLRPARFITLVRDPIARNISGFFHNYYMRQLRPRDALGMPGFQRDRGLFDPEALLRRFLDEYPHGTPLRWFDREVNDVLGIDVYRHRFDSSLGWLAIRHPKWPILILRSDMPDSEKCPVIADYLGLERFDMRTMNVGASRLYADAYNRFIDQIALPVPYVRRMLSSKYARHFFSDSERSRLTEKWTKA